MVLSYSTLRCELQVLDSEWNRRTIRRTSMDFKLSRNLDVVYIPSLQGPYALTRLNSLKAISNCRFRLNFHFWEKKKHNKSEFPDFYEFTLSTWPGMIFKIVYEKSHYRNGRFQENREYQIDFGWIRNNPRIRPSYHFFDFSSKMGI